VYPPVEETVPPFALCMPKYLTITIPDPPLPAGLELPEPPPPPPVLVVPDVARGPPIV
jgi:hypothetical protein